MFVSKRKGQGFSTLTIRGAFLPAVEHFYIIAGHLFGMVATIDQAKKANFCSQLQKQ
uniref:Uncharacterized protein n=1 Tax=Siphoviridae sp. ctHAs12 TaxID=2827826 RepID=A0A8S5SI18_9CAUD|nr:MAG TPA: hypothetical protein [Siphoviridae sp. ctHAs12]